jgi:phenylacetate-CoA ligase
MALLTWHERDHGIPPRARFATFAGRLVQPVTDDRPPFWRTNWTERQLLCSAYHLSDANLPLYLKALERFQPVEIIGYASAIATVASFCRRTGVRPRLAVTAVVTNSETLLAWQREVIEDVFAAPVCDYYGTAEAVVFAGQCRAGRYHPHPLMGHAEVLDARDEPVDPGGTGRLVCTTLCNEAMPLIRYEMGDGVTRSAEPCPCGRPGDAWDAVVGRVDDDVVTPGGHHVGRLDHIFKGVTAIREAQIAQTRPDRLEVRVVRDIGYSEKTARLISENLAARVGTAMHIDIVLVDAIPRTSRGKFRSVVNEMDRGPDRGSP